MMQVDCPSPGPSEAVAEVASHPLTEDEANGLSDPDLIRRVLAMVDADPVLRAGRAGGYSPVAAQVISLERPVTRAFPGMAPLGFHNARLTLRGQSTSVSPELCAFSTLDVDFRPAVEVPYYVVNTTPMAPSAVEEEVRFVARGEAAERARSATCSGLDAPQRSIYAKDAATAWHGISMLRSLKSRLTGDAAAGRLSCEDLETVECRTAVSQARVIQISRVDDCAAEAVPEIRRPELNAGEACVWIRGVVGSRWGFGANGWDIVLFHPIGAPEDVQRVSYSAWRLVV